MILLMLAALMGAASLQHVAEDERVVGFLSDVLVRAAVYNDFSETGAFLVRDTRGEIQCLMWPVTNEYHRLTFSGGVPLGTIAIVHTHPQLQPEPSVEDVDLAHQIRVPMLVLTRSTITGIDPVSRQTFSLVERRVWAQPPGERCETDWLAR